MSAAISESLPRRSYTLALLTLMSAVAFMDRQILAVPEFRCDVP